MRFALFSLIFLIFLATVYTVSNPKAFLPYLGEVSDFELVSAENQKVNLATFKDKVWVANFFFSSCPHICPVMNAEVAKVASKFSPQKKVMFASISVDPQTDTPEVLKEYAKKFKADPAKWLFLTGDIEQVKKLSVESFKLAGPDDKTLHSTRLVLIDKSGRVRGYYSSEDPEAMKKLERDIFGIVNAKR